MSRRLKPKDLLDVTADQFDLATQVQLAKFLGLTQPRISHILNSAEITRKNLTTVLRAAFRAGQKEAQGRTNSLLLEKFKELRGLNTQSEVANALRRTQGAIAQWKTG